jgi:hypothetical protein
MTISKITEAIAIKLLPQQAAIYFSGGIHHPIEATFKELDLKRL